MSKRSYMSRSNARRAAAQAGINLPDISVYHLNTLERAEKFGFGKEHVGRYIYVNSGADVELEIEPIRFCGVCGKVAHDGECTSANEDSESLVEIARRESDPDDDVPDLDPEEIRIPLGNGMVITTTNTMKSNLDQSTVEKPVALTHQIANEMEQAALEAGAPAPRRKDVIAACVAQGIAINTARTQYQVWFKNKRRGAAATVPPAHIDHDAN